MSLHTLRVTVVVFVSLYFGAAPCQGNSLGRAGIQVVSNLHTDKNHETRAQITPIDIPGTNKTPLVVEIKKSDPDLAEKIAAIRNQDRVTRINLYIMYFTGGAMFVGLFQLGFFYWQLRLMRTSVKSTELAAKAAEFNARAAVGIELPVLRVLLPDLISTGHLLQQNEPYGGGVNDGPPEKFSAVGLLIIRNYGRTPAFPEELSVGWSVSKVLPKTPHYTQRSRLTHASVIQPDGEFMADVHYGIELSDEDIQAARSGNSWLWFYGCIYYTDFIQQRRKARFCWRFANRNIDNVFYSFASDGEPPPAYIQNA